ncbi:hypothetical protein G9P44_003126 [Scheffersomyces stipitis]|nr:hypothetical protein G9P44_003126 [Scheffersomyces stipitis]
MDDVLLLLHIWNNRFPERIAHFRADNAKELPDTESLAKLGIKRDKIASYSPELNGLAESHNRTILRNIYKIILQFPNYTDKVLCLFDHIIEYVSYIKNHTPNKALKGRTPYEVFNKLDAYRPTYIQFGLDVSVKASSPEEFKKLHIPLPNAPANPNNKQYPMTFFGTFIGFCEDNYTYKILVSTKNFPVIQTVNVKFMSSMAHINSYFKSLDFSQIQEANEVKATLNAQVAAAQFKLNQEAHDYDTFESVRQENVPSTSAGIHEKSAVMTRGISEARRDPSPTDNYSTDPQPSFSILAKKHPEVYTNVTNKFPWMTNPEHPKPITTTDKTHKESTSTAINSSTLVGGTNVRTPTPVNKQVAPVSGEDIQRDTPSGYKSDSGITSTQREQKADETKYELINEDAPVATLKESQNPASKQIIVKDHNNKSDNANDKHIPAAIEITELNSDTKSSKDTGNVKTKHGIVQPIDNQGESTTIKNEPEMIQAPSNRDVRALKRQRMQEGLTPEPSVKLKRSPNFTPESKTLKTRTKTHPGQKSSVYSVSAKTKTDIEGGDNKRQRKTSPDFSSISTINLMASLIESRSTDVCTNIEGAHCLFSLIDQIEEDSDDLPINVINAVIENIDYNDKNWIESMDREIDKIH